MRYLYLFVLIFISGCVTVANNPYYRSHQSLTENMLKQGKFQLAIDTDREVLEFNGDAGQAMGTIYLSNNNFQKGYQSILLNKIISAKSKKEITLLTKEIESILSFNVFHKKTALNIKLELLSAIKQGNANGLFPFVLKDQDDFLTHLSDKKSSDIIFKRTVFWVEEKKGKREELLSTISDHLDYSENKNDSSYIANHSIKMRITPKEYRQYFIKHIPDFNKILKNKSSIKINLTTSNINKTLRRFIERSINDRSYKIKVINKHVKKSHKVTITKEYLKSYKKSSVITESVAMSRLGTSAISGIIMAVKGVSGRNSTLIYNINKQQITTEFKIKLCLKPPQSNQKCSILEDMIIIEKNECFSPRLLRDNGQTIKINHYPMAGIERTCLEENQKNLNTQLYQTLADSIANKLVEFNEVAIHID